MTITPCKVCGCFLPMIRERKESSLMSAEFTITCWGCDNILTVWVNTREEALNEWNKENENKNRTTKT